MELIDRYVYAVVKHLPVAQRADIDKELRGLIEDMTAETVASGQPEKTAIDTVLRKLGHPTLLAAQYRGAEQHLIGPGLYYLYVLVLKIVLLATGGGLLIAMLVNLLVHGSEAPVQTVLETIGSLFIGLIGAFGWVTLIFAAIERYSPEKIDVAKSETFDPRDLPEIPRKEERIHPADPIASMIFILIAMILANFVPRLVGLYWTGMPGGQMVPLFNEPVYRLYLPFILATLGIAMIKEIAKLVTGRWTIALSIGALLIDIPGLILTIVMFNHPGLFNPDFFTQMFALIQSADPMLLGLPLPSFLARTIIGLALFGFAVDTIKTVAMVIRKAIKL